MKNADLNKRIRLIVFFCGILLIPVLFYPIWRIELDAPQYPEGLMMNISANGLGGDVAIINGLNHYIGMKTLHNEDFIEFKILPYLIVFFAAFFILTAIVGKRKLMRALLVSFLLFGIVAMVDFWKWEYNYGHNLDPNAAIIVPGMSYQPPLIGFKQLLNFGAYSVPDIGGWLFIAAGLLLFACVAADYYKIKKTVKLPAQAGALAGIALICTFTGCNVEPEPIKIGQDNCHYCKMTISDNRFGAEVVTTKGKIFKYDELHCLSSAIADKEIDLKIINGIYFTDFAEPHGLVKREQGFYLISDEIKGPMGGNIATFSSRDNLLNFQKETGGSEISWEQLIDEK